MAFIYDEGSAARSNVDVWKMNGTAAYLRHYENLLYLTFIANNERSTRVERAQAEKELQICQRKLAFWERHPNYNHTAAMQGVEKLKRNWRSAA